MCITLDVPTNLHCNPPSPKPHSATATLLDVPIFPCLQLLRPAQILLLQRGNAFVLFNSVPLAFRMLVLLRVAPDVHDS
jgi:hypothetical protein